MIHHTHNNKKKQFKILSILTVCVIAVIAGYVIFIQAASVSDDFSTENDVADTWRITVATTTGEVKLEVKSCDNSVWFCDDANICSNTLGDGDYILVKRTDVGSPTTQKWKETNTACDQPQCGQDGGQDLDNLVADNTVSFSVYPARDACKAVGGRLPTKTELDYMYLNKATFGDNFVADYYWSSTEYNVTNAWRQPFSNGDQNANGKDNGGYVRCVRGW